jgi:hypothetical protein
MVGEGRAGGRASPGEGGGGGATGGGEAVLVTQRRWERSFVTPQRLG